MTAPTKEGSAMFEAVPQQADDREPADELRFMTLTAYAAQRGVSVKAVSKAIAVGRLTKSVVRDQHGAPKIRDPALADREWEANTRQRADHVTESRAMSLREVARGLGVTHSALSDRIHRGLLCAGVSFDERNNIVVTDPQALAAEWQATHTLRPAMPRTIEPDRSPLPVSDYTASRTEHARSVARRQQAQAEMAELELAERRGELVRIDDVRGDVFARFTMVRTLLLAVPSRVAQQIPELATEVAPVVEALIREALEELADHEVGQPRDQDDQDGDE